MLNSLYSDYQGNPIEKCQVGEVFTDKKGYFRLPEERYYEFTFIGFEAPPVYVREEVKKEGYEPDAIVMMSRYDFERKMKKVIES